MATPPAFRRTIRIGGLCALIGLTAPGCDLLESADVLSSVSSADLSDIEDFIGTDLACNADVESFTGSESGALADDDCTLDDGSFADFYAFEIGEDADVRIEQDSNDFPPYLLVYEVDINDETLTLVASDENPSDDDQARIDESLNSGVYLVVANAVSVGQTGDYTLTIEADPQDSGSNRPAARPVGTAKTLVARD
jgi:hypothetical protein